MDPVPTILGVLLVAIVAGFALMPLLRGGAAPATPTAAIITDPAEAERFRIYRQVLELEFDQQTGKLATEDFEALTRELLARAGEILRTERAEIASGEIVAATSPATNVDDEVEREIAAARKAFAQARRRENRTRKAEVAP